MHISKVVNPSINPAPPTLREMLDHIDRTTSPGSRERGEARSAVRSFAAWCERDPEEILASAAFMRRTFERLHPVALGIGKGRFQNVRSILKRLLGAMGSVAPRATHSVPMTEEWRGLRERIAEPVAQSLLKRFCGFCSSMDIAPNEVDDGVVAAFQKRLEAEDVFRRPYVAAQSLVRLWNRLRSGAPGWPDRVLTPLRRSERYTLEWEKLPAAFASDAASYLDLQAGSDPTHPLAPPRPLQPLSLWTRRYQIQQIVSALHHEGVDISEFTGLADLFRPGYARLALRYFIERQKQRKGADTEVATKMIGGLADTLRILAKHYVGVPEAELAEMTRFCSRLNRRRVGMGEKNRQRLRQLDDPEVCRRFLNHARLEMGGLAGIRTPTRKDAVRYGTLLGIEILLLAPMRVENLAGLDLDHHIAMQGHRKKRQVRISVPLGEVKNQRPLEYLISAASADLFQIYLDRFRPFLLSRPLRALFPGRKGGPKRPASLSKQISVLLKKELGLDWHPHLFRHFAARIQLKYHPGSYEDVRRLLGNADLEIVCQTYEGGEMLPAVERYDELIARLRGPAAPVKRTKPKAPGRSPPAAPEDE